MLVAHPEPELMRYSTKRMFGISHACNFVDVLVATHLRSAVDLGLGGTTPPKYRQH